MKAPRLGISIHNLISALGFSCVKSPIICLIQSPASVPSYFEATNHMYDPLIEGRNGSILQCNDWNCMERLWPNAANLQQLARPKSTYRTRSADQVSFHMDAAQTKATDQSVSDVEIVLSFRTAVVPTLGGKHESYSTDRYEFGRSRTWFTTRR